MLLSGFLMLLLGAADPAPDLVVVNGRVWTADPAAPWAEAVAMKDGVITRVGRTAQVRAIAGEARTIDARGRLVVPGFNDAHIHFLGGSQRLTEVDLTGACTLESIQARIRDWALSHPQAPWITGGGWEYLCFPGGRLPTRQDLDAVVSDRPAFLSAYDGHTSWANSKALALASVTAQTQFTGFGEIVRDPKTGEPTGALKEGASRLIRRLVPAATREQKLTALRKGLELAASLGITSIQNASGDTDELSLWDQLLREDRLTMRVAFAMSMGMGCDSIASLKDKYPGPLLKVAAVKFMLDGVIESHTAAMLAPYADAPETSGKLARIESEYRAAVQGCHDRGFQIFTHAIGDRAVRAALDAYAPLGTAARARVEHIETIDAVDIPRFGQLGVLASMMPIHADPDTIEVWARAVGPQRLPRSFAWRSLERAGAKLVFSSDWPASISVDPIRGLHNAVNRLTTKGTPEGGWLPAERVSLETALRGYTTVAAYAEFAENKKGQIKSGQAADLVILSRDLFRIPAAEIHTVRVETTIFNGKPIYQR